MALGSVPNRRDRARGALMSAYQLKEIQMYYGGGILGTILIIALIVFLVRRS
jgi:nitrate reductase gamma subunit